MSKRKLGFPKLGSNIIEDHLLFVLYHASVQKKTM